MLHINLALVHPVVLPSDDARKHIPGVREHHRCEQNRDHAANNRRLKPPPAHVEAHVEFAYGEKVDNFAQPPPSCLPFHYYIKTMNELYNIFE